MQVVKNEFEFIDYISNNEKFLNCKIVIEKFSSGAHMIDIWVRDFMLVIQIYQGKLGASKIQKDFAEFSSNPDIIFTNYQELINFLEKEIC